MAIAYDKELGRRMCETLGLDPKKVRSIRLILEPNQAVVATIEFYPDEKEMELIDLELKRYKLVRIDD